MIIQNYFEGSESQKASWMKQLEQSDWPAGQSLCRRMQDGSFFVKTGEGTELLLMIDESTGNIASYCTLAKWDDIQPTAKTPWIGYVYTWPQYRGQGLMATLIQEAERRAAARGARDIWISTGHEGLYERYGYSFAGLEPDIHGSLSRVYHKSLEPAEG